MGPLFIPLRLIVPFYLKRDKFVNHYMKKHHANFDMVLRNKN